MLFARLLSTRSALPVFGLAVFLVYCVMPAYLNAAIHENEYLSQLAAITLVGCIALCIGYSLPLLDGLFAPSASRISINGPAFHGVVWGTFLVFLIVTISTAGSIPLLSALQGASVSELDQQRGAFLKGREGIEAALPYLATLFLGALLPYSLVHLFVQKSRWRYALTFAFLAFSVSFLVKSLFINVAFPLLYYVALRKKTSVSALLAIIAGSLLLLYVLTKFAVGDSLSVNDMPIEQFDPATFFKMSYSANGLAEFLVWRSIAVPMVTAADTLRVHIETFGGDLLYGATSSLFAAVFSMDRIPLERLVFAHQFGWNETANANSIFLTEAFVNFGWMGALIFSMIVGQSLRCFANSRDVGFKSLWILYCFSLFSGGLIGTLLSNGYIVIFVMALFCRLEQPAKRTGPYQNKLVGRSPNVVKS